MSAGRHKGSGASQTVRFRLKKDEARDLEKSSQKHPQGKSGVIRDALKKAGVLTTSNRGE